MGKIQSLRPGGTRKGCSLPHRGDVAHAQCCPPGRLIRDSGPGVVTGPRAAAPCLAGTELWAARGRWAQHPPCHLYSLGTCSYSPLFREGSPETRVPICSRGPTLQEDDDDVNMRSTSVCSYDSFLREIDPWKKYKTALPDINQTRRLTQTRTQTLDLTLMTWVNFWLGWLGAVPKIGRSPAGFQVGAQAWVAGWASTWAHV